MKCGITITITTKRHNSRNNLFIHQMIICDSTSMGIPVQCVCVKTRTLSYRLPLLSFALQIVIAKAPLTVGCYHGRHTSAPLFTTTERNRFHYRDADDNCNAAIPPNDIRHKAKRLQMAFLKRMCFVEEMRLRSITKRVR